MHKLCSYIWDWYSVQAVIYWEWYGPFLFFVPSKKLHGPLRALGVFGFLALRIFRQENTERSENSIPFDLQYIWDLDFAWNWGSLCVSHYYFAVFYLTARIYTGGLRCRIPSKLVLGQFTLVATHPQTRFRNCIYSFLWFNRECLNTPRFIMKIHWFKKRAFFFGPFSCFLRLPFLPWTKTSKQKN